MYRNDAPVFVVGSARSGNTLLYHMLLSSGYFAVYLTEPAVFDLLLPRFGNMRAGRSRRKLLEEWLRSKQFRCSGLNRQQVEEIILARWSGGGAFLANTMAEIARLQGLRRWAVWGPDNLLYMPVIKREIPEALFIHTIRDGRDVAVCLNKEGWIRPFPGDRGASLLVSGLHWRWKVRKGRECAAVVKPDYLEVRFEDLVTEPRQTLANVGRFLNADLDYDRILTTGIGVVRRPNSSFLPGDGGTFNPVGRWRTVLSQSETAALEASIGDLLSELGYAVEARRTERIEDLTCRCRRIAYSSWFGSRLWLKSNTPLGRWTNSDRLCLE